jgi:hypothetical protein
MAHGSRTYVEPSRNALLPDAWSPWDCRDQAPCPRLVDHGRRVCGGQRAMRLEPGRSRAQPRRYACRRCGGPTTGLLRGQP